MSLQELQTNETDLTATGTVGAPLNPGGATKTTVVMDNSGGNSVTVEVQVRAQDASEWVTRKTYSSVSSIGDTIEVTCYEMRLRITSSATAGTADFYFGAGSHS